MKKAALQKVFNENVLRNVADWDAAKVKAALALMARGNWSQAGMLMDAVLADLRIQSVLGVRSRAITTLPLKFTHPQPKVAEALEADFWNILPEPDLIALHVRGILAGAAIAQLCWDTSGERWLPKVQPWHPALQRYDVEKKIWEVNTKEGWITITPGDGKWLLYTPSGDSQPWLHALIRGLGVLYMLKRFNLSDWSNFNEVHGGPIRVGTGSANKEEVQQMAKDLQGMGGNTAIALTEGRDIRLVEATSQSWRSFKEQIQWVDSEIAIGILGQNLSTEVSGGSLAAAEVHERIRRDIVTADCEGLETALNQQVFSHWATVNFSTEAPWAEFDSHLPKPPPPIEEWHVTAGVVTIDEMRERLGLPPLGKNAQKRTEAATNSPASGKMLSQSSQDFTSPLKPVQSFEASTPTLLASNPSEGNGQDYIDHMTAQSLQNAPQSLTEQLLQAVEGAKDYQEIRQRILSWQLDPTQSAQIINQALILAHLTGRLEAANER